MRLAELLSERFVQTYQAKYPSAVKTWLDAVAGQPEVAQDEVQ